MTEIASNPTDNEFLLEMKKVIEENFSNSGLNVNYLAEKLNISRSGLFAKIKTLACFQKQFGVRPMDYIKQST